MKTGRPTNAEKKRKRTIKLTSFASQILEELKQKRPKFDFSQYISETIIKDFSTKERFLRRQIGDIGTEIDKLRRMQDFYVDEVRILQDKKQAEILEKELQTR